MARFEAEWLATEANLAALADLSGPEVCPVESATR
jgi:hypothetical protein